MKKHKLLSLVLAVVLLVSAVYVPITTVFANQSTDPAGITFVQTAGADTEADTTDDEYTMIFGTKIENDTNDTKDDNIVSYTILEAAAKANNIPKNKYDNIAFDPTKEENANNPKYVDSYAVTKLQIYSVVKIADAHDIAPSSDAEHNGAFNMFKQIGEIEWMNDNAGFNYIGKNAFSGNQALKELTLPSVGLTFIGGNAFRKTYVLEKLVIEPVAETGIEIDDYALTEMGAKKAVSGKTKVYFEETGLNTPYTAKNSMGQNKPIEWWGGGLDIYSDHGTKLYTEFLSIYASNAQYFNHYNNAIKFDKETGVLTLGASVTELRQSTINGAVGGEANAPLVKKIVVRGKVHLKNVYTGSGSWDWYGPFRFTTNLEEIAFEGDGCITRVDDYVFNNSGGGPKGLLEVKFPKGLTYFGGYNAENTYIRRYVFPEATTDEETGKIIPIEFGGNTFVWGAAISGEKSIGVLEFRGTAAGSYKFAATEHAYSEKAASYALDDIKGTAIFYDNVAVFDTAFGDSLGVTETATTKVPDYNKNPKVYVDPLKKTLVAFNASDSEILTVTNDDIKYAVKNIAYTNEELTFAPIGKVKLDANAFSGGNANVTKVDFNYTAELMGVKKTGGVITEVGQAALQGLKVQSLEFPEGLVTIKNYQLQNNTTLKTLILPASLKSLPNDFLGGDKGFALEKIEWKTTEITSIGTMSSAPHTSAVAEILVQNADCKAKVQAAMDANPTDTFYSKANLTYVGEDPFKDFYTTDSQTVITGYSGKGGNIQIPNKVVKVADGAFVAGEGNNSPNCTNDSIKGLIFSNTVTEVGSYLVKNSTGVTTINFRDSANLGTLTIADNAFAGSTGITDITLPKQTVSIGKNLVETPVSLTIRSENVVFAEGTFSEKNNGSVIYVPSKDCATTSNLIAATNGLKVTIIEESQKDKDFVVDIYGTLCAYNGKESTATIPTTVQKIGEGAFSENTVVTKVEIPYTVTEIASNFIKGTNVSKVDFLATPAGEEDKALVINGYAFADSKIAVLKLPERLTELKANALSGCVGVLRQVYMAKDDYSFAMDTFKDDCTGILLYVPTLTGDTYNTVKNVTGYGIAVTALVDQTNLSSDFVIEDGNLIDYRGTATEITIPSHVLTIKQYAFRGKTTLEKITIPYTVSRIEGYAFENASNLKEIVFEDAPQGQENAFSLEIVGWTFSGINNTAFTHIDMPSHKLVLGTCAFNGTANLQYVSIRSKNVKYSPSPDNEFDGKVTYTFRGLPNSIPVFFDRAAQNEQPFTDFIKRVDWKNTPDNTADDLPYVHANSWGKNPYALFMEGNTAEAAALAFSKINPDFPVDYTGYLSTYNGTDENVVIPDTVFDIAQYTFKGNTSIKTIFVPNSVKHIAGYAFEGCSNLEEIIFEDAPQGKEKDEANYLLTLEPWAFQSCVKLEHLDMPDRPIYLESAGVFGTKALEYISFRGSVIKYDTTNEFVDKDGVPQVSYAFRFLPKRIPVFFNRDAQNTQAFKDFTKKVTYTTSGGSTVTRDLFYTNGTPMPYFRFMENDNSAAAYEATNKDFIIDGWGNLTKYVGSSADVKVPNDVTAIRTQTFAYNEEIKTLYIPANVQLIENLIVQGCTQLNRIDFEQVASNLVNSYSVTINGWAFQETGTYVRDEDGNQIWSNGIEELVLPNYKIDLDGYALGGLNCCKGIILRSRDVVYAYEDPSNPETSRGTSFRLIASTYAPVPVFFPKENQNSEAFKGLTRTLNGKSTRFQWDYGTGFSVQFLDADGNPDYSKINPDFAIDYEGYMTNYSGPGGNVIIPYGVTKIAEHAFDSVRGANNIISVNFPSTLKELETVIFKNMSNLKTVTFNEGTEDIGNFNFEGTSIKEIVLPSTIKKMKSGTFGGMKQLEKVTIYAKNIQIVDPNNPADTTNPFLYIGAVPTVYVVAGSPTYEEVRNCEGADGTKFVLKTIGSTEYPGYKIINNELKEYTGTETDIVIPEEITRISAKVFQNNENIKSVTIHDGVISIGESTFEGCKNLTEINLSEGLKKIGNNAFKGTAVEKVSIPSTVASVSRSAFGDTPLKAIYVLGYKTKLPNSLGYKGAFENVNGLTIYAAYGSAAYDYATKFADKHGFKFEMLQISALGANGTEKPDKTKIRFRTQTVSGDTVTIDGTECKILERGGLVIPTDLLEGKELVIDTPSAGVGKHTIIVTKEKEYYEYELTFENIPSNSASRNMAFRPFIKYEDENGKTAYLYGNTIHRNAVALNAFTEGNN